jgi:hypothetical protein
MKARVFDSGFVIVFLLMLTAPLVCIDLYSDRSSEKENRMLANPPQLDDIKEHPRVFIREFDAWFKDSVGFRENLIGLYSVVNNNGLLHGRYKDGQHIILIGQEGHRYWAGVDKKLISKYQGKPVFSDEELRDFASTLNTIGDYLNKKDIPFIVMFCDSKESIYPEFYPKTIKRGPEPAQLDVITSYLKNHTNADVFNIRKGLLLEKEHYLLYAKSAKPGFWGELSHYNGIAAFFAYRELMKHVNNYFPEMTPFTLNNITITYAPEGFHTVSLKEKLYKRLDVSFFDDIPWNKERIYESAAFENDNTRLPTILILRDSFAEEHFLTQYIASHFGKTILIHYRNMEHFEEYIAKYVPDIVVFETAEVQITHFASFVARLQLP